MPAFNIFILLNTQGSGHGQRSGKYLSTEATHFQFVSFCLLIPKHISTVTFLAIYSASCSNEVMPSVRACFSHAIKDICLATSGPRQKLVCVKSRGRDICCYWWC